MRGSCGSARGSGGVVGLVSPWVLDTDAGADDLFAIALLAGLRAPPPALVTTTHGLAPSPADASDYVRRVLRAVGWPDVPVVPGAPTWQAGSDGKSVLDESWGAEYRAMLAQLVDDVLPASTSSTGPVPSAEAAAAAIARVVEGHPPQTVSLVTLGPLTNIAALPPGMARQFRAVVVMGGAVRGPEEPGDRKAEFNFACDPAAAAQVVSEGANLVLGELAVAKATASAKDAVLAQLSRDADSTHGRDGSRGLMGRLARGCPGCVLYDPVIAAGLVHETVWAVEPAHVSVDATSGGLVTEDADGVAVSLAVDFDENGYVDAVRSALLR